MGTFLNHNSFLLAILLIWALFAAYLLRSGPPRKRLPTLIVISLALAALYFSLSPRDATSGDTDEILGGIGTGTPVLLEFKSPN